MFSNLIIFFLEFFSLINEKRILRFSAMKLMENETNFRFVKTGKVN